jgi:hypothetical protein
MKENIMVSQAESTITTAAVPAASSIVYQTAPPTGTVRVQTQVIPPSRG